MNVEKKNQSPYWDSTSDIVEIVIGVLMPNRGPQPGDVVFKEDLVSQAQIEELKNGAWPKEGVEIHDTGAKRGTDVNGLRFDLLSPVVLMSMAGVFAEGAHKYGDHNYLKGFKFSGLLSHAINHLCMFMLGDKSEPHLTHAAWNINAMIHFSLTKPEMNDLHDHQLTPEQITEIKKILTFVPQPKPPEAK